MIFNFNINKEINETSENQITSIKHAIEQHDNVNQGHDYFIVKHKVISNHTPFSIRELQKFIGKEKIILIKVIKVFSMLGKSNFKSANII